MRDLSSEARGDRDSEPVVCIRFHSAGGLGLRLCAVIQSGGGCGELQLELRDCHADDWALKQDGKSARFQRERSVVRVGWQWGSGAW